MANLGLTNLAKPAAACQRRQCVNQTDYWEAQEQMLAARFCKIQKVHTRWNCEQAWLLATAICSSTVMPKLMWNAIKTRLRGRHCFADSFRHFVAAGVTAFKLSKNGIPPFPLPPRSVRSLFHSTHSCACYFLFKVVTYHSRAQLGSSGIFLMTLNHWR